MASKNGEPLDEFELGYLLACTNMMNLHGDSVVAGDALIQEIDTEAIIRFVAHNDPTDYDKDALFEIVRGRPIRFTDEQMVRLKNLGVPSEKVDPMAAQQ